jgi:glyoxylase-like metal-dependent hydrolase (beta-lactamase superfamily II)
MTSDLIVRFLTVGVFAENSYVLGAGGAGVLVDPGGEVPELLATAERLGLEIEAIWLTHAHIDHLLGVGEAVERTGVDVALHEDDRFLYDGAAEQGMAFGLEIAPLPAPGIALHDGARLSLGGLEVEVLHVPGHSPGHVAFWIPAARALVSGDVLFAGSIGRTDLPGGSYDTLIASIRRQILPLGDDVRVYAGHGPPTSVGVERRTNPFLTGG